MKDNCTAAMQYKLLNTGAKSYLCVKFVVTKVQRRVYRPKRFKVNVDLLFFPFFCNDGTTIYHKAIWWDCNGQKKFYYSFLSCIHFCF